MSRSEVDLLCMGSHAVGSIVISASRLSETLVFPPGQSSEQEPSNLSVLVGDRALCSCFECLGDYLISGSLFSRVPRPQETLMPGSRDGCLRVLYFYCTRTAVMPGGNLKFLPLNSHAFLPSISSEHLHTLLGGDFQRLFSLSLTIAGKMTQGWGEGGTDGRALAPRRVGEKQKHICFCFMEHLRTILQLEEINKIPLK